MKYNYSDIEEYLALWPPGMIKDNLGFCLISLNLIGIPTCIFGAAKDITVYLLGIVLILDIWLIYQLAQKGYKQKQYELFMGIYCFVFSNILLLGLYKFIYLDLSGFSGLDSHISFIIGIVLTLYYLILIFEMIIIVRALQNGYFSPRSKHRKPSKLILAIGSLGGMGIPLGVLCKYTLGSEIFDIIGITAWIIVAYGFALGTHKIYQYYLIKQFDDYIKEEVPKKRTVRKAARPQ